MCNLNDPGSPEAGSKSRDLLSVRTLAAQFHGCADFETRTVDFGLGPEVQIVACWIDGLVSGSTVTEEILRPLTEAARSGGVESSRAALERILRGSVYRYSVQVRRSLGDAVGDLTHGHCLLFFEQADAVLSFEARCEQTRAIDQPTLEKSLKGAKDSFVETLRVNTALIRRRICSPQLKLAECSIGLRTQTRVSILYMEGIADPAVVRTLAKRLAAIHVDGLLATGVLEEAVADAPLSPFPQLLHTERPDRLAMYLLDGRVGLLVDGLPIALVLPVSLAEFMKVTGDASVHYTAATALTLLRWAALLLSLLTPAFYVAITRFHLEMIPTRLLLSVIEAEQDVPFSPFLEVLGMLFAFGLLQEAGLRLPNPVGDTVSIIGALIVGQAAVEAKLISPISIIVVAISGIGCYALPSQDLASALRLWRMALLLAGAIGGLYGVGLGACLLLLHLSDLESFGVSYTAPLSESRSGMSRLLIRIPKLWNFFRDPSLRTPDRRRQA